MEEPQAKVCGSTSVLCPLSPFLKVSLLSLASVNCACSSAFRDMERAVRNTATIQADNHLSDEARIMKSSLGHRGSPRATGKCQRGGIVERSPVAPVNVTGFCIRRHWQ